VHCDTVTTMQNKPHAHTLQFNFTNYLLYISRLEVVIKQALWYNVCPLIWYMVSHQYVDTQR